MRDLEIRKARLSDLNAWMRNAYRVLKIGGRLVAQDFQPISWVAKDWRAKIDDGIVAFRKSHLDQSPEVSWPEDGFPPSITFIWKISDVVNAAVSSGFWINRLEEFYYEPEGRLNLIPNKYLIVATKIRECDY